MTFINALPYLAIVILTLFGLTMMLTQKNLIKIIMGVALFEAAVNLFLVTLGYRNGGIAPIYTNAPADALMVLPTVQALTLTSIVIGLATTAVLLSFAIVLYKRYGTVDIDAIKELKG
jgi:multicomponent Na+:H+ antiporter subunit C